MATEFGRYKIAEEIGRGAMGVVFRAIDPAIGRTVALKAINESYLTLIGVKTDEYFERFRREAEVAGRLNHPNIVKIYDLGPSYLVMEFVEGETLAAILRSRARLPPSRILQIVTEAADALDYAHRQGVVHRDIKPANFMIQPNGSLKIMDFGLARIEASTLTAAGEILGSAAYMAPELITERPADGRSDLFSLGVVVYELLTGDRPFAGGSISAIISNILHDKPRPLTDLNLNLPPDYDEILARALAKEPADRYATATEFANALVKQWGDREGEEALRDPSTTQTVVPTQTLVPLQAAIPTQISLVSDEATEAGAAPTSPGAPELPLGATLTINVPEATLIDVLAELPKLVESPPADGGALDGARSAVAEPPPAAVVAPSPPPIGSAEATYVSDSTVVDPTTVSEVGPTSSSDAVAAASAADAGPPSAGAEATRRRIPWVPLAIGLVLMMAVVLGGGILAARWLLGVGGGSEARGPEPTVASPVAAPEPSPPLDVRTEPIEEPSLAPEVVPATPITTAPARATLIVSSIPSGARVTIGRRARGNTPLKLELAPGRITVGVHKDGYRPWVQEVSLPAREAVSVQAQLEAIPVAIPTTAPSPTAPPLQRGDLVALTPDVKPPKRISGDSPALPRSGPKYKLPASVLVEFVVTEEGRVRDARVLESGGEALDRVCTEVVSRWRYEPAETRGLQVSVTLRARFSFQSR